MFLHRIGRTGRAGANGVAVTFVDWDDSPKWGLINKALDLTFPEPLETYSSSPHLFSDLSIPVGTKGTLPRSARVRAGLEAEHVEDLGETGRKRPAAGGRDGGRSGGRDGGRDSGRDGGRSGGREGVQDSGRNAAAVEGDDAPVLPKRTGSSRRRSRGGGEAVVAATAAGPVTEAGGSGDADGAARPRRRRGGRGRGRGAGEGGAGGSGAGGSGAGEGGGSSQATPTD